MTISRIALAWALVGHHFAGKTYGVRPYTYHLRQVWESVKAAYPNDERLEEVAIFHDLLEDTDCKEEMLRALFEDNVVDAVVAISKVEGESAEEYERRVCSNSMALKVKLHDAKCNMAESLICGDMKRVRKYSSLISRLSHGGTA